MNSPKSLLEIRIDHLYYGERSLCSGISLNVQMGERILIVGSTGSGKTSLLSTLNLMNQSYDGSILFEGKEIRDYKPEHLRSRICLVMQEPWLEDVSIAENLILPLGYQAHKHRQDHARDKKVSELFDAFQLPLSLLQEPASRLSGGEKQRVSLIRALQLQPEILLLDEISSALDQKTSGIISDCIFSNYPGTVIAISHDPLWQSHWQRLWRLEGGKLSDSTQTGGR